MAQLCLLCKCEAAKKTRRRLSESLLPALRAVHRVAWPDRGETADDPSWSESFPLHTSTCSTVEVVQDNQLPWKARQECTL